MQRKIFRAAALSLTCLASLASLSVHAQGLRLPGGAGTPSSLQGLPPAGKAPAAPAGVRQADFIVAVVNSEPITNNEVQARLQTVLPQFAGRPNAPSPDMLARELLEQLIVERAQLQEAQKMGLTVDDFVLERAEQGVAAQNGVTLEGLHQQLARDGMTVTGFRQDLRNQLLLQRVRERAVDSRSPVSEAEVEAYLRDMQRNADAPENLNLAHLLVAVPEGAAAAQVQQLQLRADALAARARAGEDFALLAREASAADVAQGQGMGLRPASRYPELFVQTVADGKVGSVAGPVRSGAGFHVLKVLEREKAVGTVQQTHARHILLRTGASVSEREAVQRLTELRRRILGGHLSFAMAAREHSHDASAADGGDLGWATPGRYVPEFEEVMNALRPGEVSEPLVSRFGVHLIEVIERRQVQPSPRELREGAREMVRERKREEAFNRWVQDLRGRAYVEYREPPQ